MNRRWNGYGAICALLLILLVLGGGATAAYAQITDFGTGGAQVTPHESGPSAAPSASGGAQSGSGGGGMAGTAQGSSGPGAGNERGVLYTLLPWLFVLTVLGGAASWLKGTRSRKGQEEVPVAEGAAAGGSGKKH